VHDHPFYWENKTWFDDGTYGHKMPCFENH